VTSRLRIAVTCLCLLPLAAPASAARLVPIANGLSDVTAMTSPAGDPRVFIAELAGTVRIMENGAVRTKPFANLRRFVRSGGEQGLLGIAFHPRYAANGLFYVNYTDTSDATVIAEFRRSATDPNVANATYRRQLMRIPQPYTNHNGGMIAFGPDGYLYIGMGDGGAGGDPQNRAQSMNSRLGKLLRIDVNRRQGKLQYAIPVGNPFRGRSGIPGEIYSIGLRNPWRFSFDRMRSGDLWIGDVGQGTQEEVNYTTLAQARGANFGWRTWEGTYRYSTTPLTIKQLIRPVAVYGHRAGCSITGGYVYRGPSIPGLDGRYVFGDFCSSRMWSMTAGPRPGGRREITNALGVRLPRTGIRTFGEGADGTLYVATGDRIWRFAR